MISVVIYPACCDDEMVRAVDSSSRVVLAGRGPKNDVGKNRRNFRASRGTNFGDVLVGEGSPVALMMMVDGVLAR